MPLQPGTTLGPYQSPPRSAKADPYARISEFHLRRERLTLGADGLSESISWPLTKMTSIPTTPRKQSRKTRVTHRAPERRAVSADRRAMWRGSRRDVDWLEHFQDEAAARRERLLEVRHTS